MTLEEIELLAEENQGRITILESNLPVLSGRIAAVEGEISDTILPALGDMDTRIADNVVLLGSLSEAITEHGTQLNQLGSEVTSFTLQLNDEFIPQIADLDDRIGVSEAQITTNTVRINESISNGNQHNTRLLSLETLVYAGDSDYISAIARINGEIDTLTVGIDGNSVGVLQAVNRATEAYSYSSLIESRSYAYTDTKFHELYHQMLVLLTQWAETVQNNANQYAQDQDTAHGNEWFADWEEKYNEMQDASNRALDFYNDMTIWVDDTLNEIIPGIFDDIEEMRLDIAENKQILAEDVKLTKEDVDSITDQWRNIADEISIMKDAIIEMDYSNYDAIDSIYRRVSADFNGRFSNYDERLTSAVSDTGATVDKVAQLELDVGDQWALIENVSRAMQEGNDLLSQQITALSVGTQSQFDTGQIWHFDTSNEGWSGIWLDGWLRVQDTIMSPVLNIDANKYRQVKMRIRRVGSPVWNGLMEWLGAAPLAQETLEEPDWGSSGYAEITVNPGWTGTLTRLMITLSSGSNAGNYFILDWLTVGRPAPGASTASLAAERSARIEQDAVSAGRIDTLEGNLATTDGKYAGVVSAIDGLRTTVNTQNGNIQALTEDVTILESTVSDLQTGVDANAQAVSILKTDVVTNTNLITATSQSITDLRNELINADGDVGVTAYAFDVLKTEVTENTNNISAASQRITNLESTIPNLASATALDALKTSVENNDAGYLTATSSKITSLESAIAGKANSSAYNSLETEVRRGPNSLTSLAQQITDLNVSLGQKADASAFQLVRATVNDTQRGVLATSQSLTSLKASLESNTRAWAVDEMAATVQNMNNKITANTNRIIGVGSEIGRFKAQGLFRVTVNSTPTGAESRIGLVAEASASDTSHRAGLFLVAQSNGETRVQIVASQFSVVNNVSGGGETAPFVIENGKIYLNANTIIKHGTIGAAHIGDASINTLKLAGNSATAIVTQEVPPAGGGGDYINRIVQSIPVQAGLGDFSIVVFVSGIMNDSGTHLILVNGDVVDAVNVANFSRYNTMQAHGRITPGSNRVVYATNRPMSGSAKMTVLIFKR